MEHDQPVWNQAEKPLVYFVVILSASGYTHAWNSLCGKSQKFVHQALVFWGGGMPYNGYHS
jgi:hypothetical protein